MALDNNEVFFDIDKIGLNNHDLLRLKKVLTLSSGLMIVTGPTSYEKSITYYSLLNEFETKDQRILTIEDLVEYNKTVDNEVCERKQNGCVISSVLDDSFKQKQKFILVGDVYNRETAEIAVQASLNGHFVLATLNTSDTLESIPYIMDLGVEPSLIARAVTVIISQRKIRELCPHCKKPLLVDTHWTLSQHLQSRVKTNKVYQADGCSQCLFTGYSGWKSLFELFFLTREIKKNISSKTTVDQLRIMAEKEDMKTLLQQGHELVRLGKTTIDEVVRQTKVQDIN